MSALKRNGDDGTPVRRSNRLVYQKYSDVVDGETSKIHRSRKLVYQVDPDDDDFVDEYPKKNNFGSKNGEKKEIKFKENNGKGSKNGEKKVVKVKENKRKVVTKFVNKPSDNLEEMGRVHLRIPPISLFRIITNLTEKQRQSVTEMGFGGILEYRLSEIPTRLGYWVLDKFDEDSCMLIFGDTTIPVTREAVHEVLGIPMGIIHIDAPKTTSRNNKLTKSWKMLFGGNISRIYHSNVEDLILSQQEGGWMFKITFLVLLFTAMGQSNMCANANLKFLPCIPGEEYIMQLNWCAYMIECLVNTKRSWNRATHFYGPVMMLLILYANSTKSLTCNVERVTPAIAFWTSSLLNQREMEEISSGGFGIHEKGEKKGNCVKQEVVVDEIPITQMCVKQEIDEAGIEDDNYNPYATQTLIDELSTPHLLDGDEGLYPILADGMFSKYGTERLPQNLEEVKKYVAIKLKMADMYLNEADICLKDAIKENPADVDLKVLLKLRNEMCDVLESNEWTTPKDKVDGTKEAANGNGGENMTSRYEISPTEIVNVSEQSMKYRQSDTHLTNVGHVMLFDRPIYDESPATKGKVLTGPKYDESPEFNTPMSNLSRVSRTDSSSKISIEKWEPKPLNIVTPNNVGEVLESPYTKEKCSVDDGITYSEKWVSDCIFTGRFPPTDIIFSTHSETHSIEVQRSVFETLYPGICIASGVIDVFTHVLNYGEKFCKTNTPRRVFCNTSMVSEKMLCEDWSAKYKSDLFIQNMTNVLKTTVYQTLKNVDLVFFPIIKGAHFYVICINLIKSEIHILDNINSDEQNLVKRYGQMLRVLTKLFEDYLSFEKHHREGRMVVAECKILRMGCRTTNNFVDCGIFAMRDMETYRGEGHYGHICGLRIEGKAQKFLLNDLRNKYVAKMLLCEINMKKEVVENETEAYKSLSIGEKRRLLENASATLLERVEQMF